MRICRGLVLLSLLLPGVAATPAQERGAKNEAKNDAVQVKVVSCDEMTEVIKKLKGKVTVVELWSLG